VTRDDFGLDEVIRQLARRGAGGFEWYKDSCLLRRIEVRMRARGVGSLTGYAALLADDPDEVSRLLHTLSVRVTSFFRNPDTWQRLREILDREALGGLGVITAWSMGCATGEEAWSLAMLLLESAGRSGAPQGRDIRVFASDLDSHALATAEAGRYPAPAVEAIRKVLDRPHGTVRDGSFEVEPAVRSRVVFRREDLTAGAPGRGRCDLVCCRNLLIFLGREGQRRVLEAAFEALHPGGLLVLGRTESLGAVPDLALLPVDLTHRIYRRAA
jgi:two-component system CheB/CheR fusion protein